MEKILKVKHLNDIPENHTGIVEYPNGTQEWYLNGKLYREDGPAIECSNGDKEYWLNGKLHREDGPAIEWPDGTKYWYLNGKVHREDGPAVIEKHERKEYCLNGKFLNKEKIEQLIKLGYPESTAIKLNNL